MENTIENFINFCDEMKIANEGKISEFIKKKIIKRKNKKSSASKNPVYEKGTPEYNERKRIYTEAKKMYVEYINKNYGNIPTLKKAITSPSTIWDSDELASNIDDFCTGKDSSIAIACWDLWDFTNGKARTEIDKSQELFDILVAPANELKKIDPKIKLDIDGDWDDGCVLIVL